MLSGFLLSGLVFGCIAGFNTLGFVLLWRTQRVVNLAQPALGLVGGTLTGILVVAEGWSFWLAAPAGLLVGIFLAYAADLLVFRRLRAAPRSALLIVSIGVAAAYAGIASVLPFLIVGGPLPTYSVDLGLQVDVFPLRLLGPHLLALVLFPIAAVVTHLLVKHTRLGLAALAIGQNLERAQVLGIPVNHVQSAVWVFAGFLSTISGILAIPVFGFSLGGRLAPLILLLSFAPAVLVGMRSFMWASLAATTIGISYRLMFLGSSRAGIADLVLAATLVLTVALHRVRRGRDESAIRASAWDSAATPRGLPREALVATPIRVLRAAIFTLLILTIVAAAIVLGPGHRVLFAGSAAIAVAVLSITAAWIFTGEVALGHWGFSGLGAVVAAIIPGNWLVRCVVATLSIALLGAFLAWVTRRRSTLGFPLLGLAVATAAPVAILALGRHTVQTDPRTIGIAAWTVAVVGAFFLAKLRTSDLGLAMIAARDEPHLAPRFGADPLIMRVVGMSISGAIAGLAGALYLAAIPAGIAPGAFDPLLSLDMLAIAVVGGLGSPAGGLAGAMIVQGARYLLPGPWGLIASGFGVIVVVTFFPGGVGGLIAAVWERIVRTLTRRTSTADQQPRDSRIRETEEALT